MGVGVEIGDVKINSEDEGKTLCMKSARLKIRALRKRKNRKFYWALKGLCFEFFTRFRFCPN